ncbi:MAG: CpaF/VirB11 family protein [Eubacteriales bacterium]|nr:CpaF/VirB11 family protein [Eubacteriales bacterium]MDD4474366.1 CpaF/VirB11 family protein [Eubacteriales bacterium]
METNDKIISVLLSVQEYISRNYAASLTDPSKFKQIKPYIEKFLRDHSLSVSGMTNKQLVDKLYSEMAEYSVLTQYLGRDELEEINVNGWNDIAITYIDGHIEKAAEHFYSPQHAVDIVKRLLHHSGMIIDNATPMSQGHLPGNTRITALKEPIVDEERGISVSIRLLHPSRVNRAELVKGSNATQKMIDFLCMCMRYGVSFVVAGATSSGKTTLLNALLTSVPDNKRIFTIESGSRELSLVRVMDGKVTNNVVHTLSRPSDNLAYDISQEDLVVASLRFNPDIVCVGEMRDVEAYSAVEASLTGHTVVSTIHAYAAESAHMRLALLCQKRFPINFDTSLMQAGQAFPIVVYVHKLEDNTRKIMDISECIISDGGKKQYRTLFRYKITENKIEEDHIKIVGHFEQLEIISDGLKQKLMQSGVPQSTLNKFLTKGVDYDCSFQ